MANADQVRHLHRAIYDALPPAVVVRIRRVEEHSNSDRGLQVVHFAVPLDFRLHGAQQAQVVTGPHYRAGTEDGRAVSSCYPFRVTFAMRQ